MGNELVIAIFVRKSPLITSSGIDFHLLLHCFLRIPSLSESESSVVGSSTGSRGKLYFRLCDVFIRPVMSCINVSSFISGSVWDELCSFVSVFDVIKWVYDVINGGKPVELDLLTSLVGVSTSMMLLLDLVSKAPERKYHQKI